MTEKAIIFDTGSLISFSMNGITEYIKKLKEIFTGKFLITSQVKFEIIDKPINIRRFQLEALKLKELLDSEILELPSSIGIKDSEVKMKTQDLMETANSTFFGRERDIHIIDEGESSCLALSSILIEKGIKNIISIDERTARLLVEKPENLRRILEDKINTKVTLKAHNLKFFKEFKIIRSTELVYVAYKKGLIKLKNHILGALLYALKYKGCAISNEEIAEIERLG